MITVGNKKHGACGVYVGRPSPLGNPFAMQGEAERAAVIRAYEDWLAEHEDERIDDEAGGGRLSLRPPGQVRLVEPRLHLVVA